MSKNNDQQNIWALRAYKKKFKKKQRQFGTITKEEGINSCVMPAMFDMPTAIQVLTSGEGESDDQTSKDYVERNVNILIHHHQHF